MDWIVAQNLFHLVRCASSSLKRFPIQSISANWVDLLIDANLLRSRPFATLKTEMRISRQLRCCSLNVEQACRFMR